MTLNSPPPSIYITLFILETKILYKRHWPSVVCDTSDHTPPKPFLIRTYKCSSRIDIAYWTARLVLRVNGAAKKWPYRIKGGGGLTDRDCSENGMELSSTRRGIGNPMLLSSEECIHGLSAPVLLFTLLMPPLSSAITVSANSSRLCFNSRISVSRSLGPVVIQLVVSVNSQLARN